MSSITLKNCAEFSLFPVNWQLPDRFLLAGFEFKNASNQQWDIRNTVNGHSLHASNGTTIRTPTIVDHLNIAAITMAHPVVVRALDSSGATLSQAVVNPHDPSSEYELSGNGIVQIVFDDDGNEFYLARVCVNLTIQTN